MEQAQATLMLAGGVSGVNSRKTQLILGQRLQSIASIFEQLPPEAAFKIKIAAPEAGIFFFEEARRLVFQEELQIMHLTGFISDSGLLEFAEGEPGEGLDATGLARWLTRFPNLKLLFLDGCATAELVDAVLRADVPAVIALEAPQAGRLPGKEASLFYAALAEGLTLAQAHARLFSQYARSFPLRHAAYDLERDELCWHDKSTQTSVSGFYLLADRAAVMDWKPAPNGAPVRIKQSGPALPWIFSGVSRRSRLFATGFFTFALFTLMFTVAGGPMKVRQLGASALAWQRGCLFDGIAEEQALWLGLFDRETGFSREQNQKFWQFFSTASAQGKFVEWSVQQSASLPTLGAAAEAMNKCQATAAVAIQQSVYRADSMEWTLLSWTSTKGRPAQQAQSLVWHSVEPPTAHFYNWWAAEIHLQRGEPSRAAEALVQIPLVNHPDYIPIARKLAFLQSKASSTTYALAYADMAVALGDRDPDLLLMRAQLNSLTGKFAASLNDYALILAQDSAHAEALFGKGVLLFSLKEISEARSVSMTFLRNHQNLGKSHGLRAAVAAAEGEISRALFELGESRRLGFEPSEMEALWVVLGPMEQKNSR